MDYWDTYSSFFFFFWHQRLLLLYTFAFQVISSFWRLLILGAGNSFWSGSVLICFAFLQMHLRSSVSVRFILMRRAHLLSISWLNISYTTRLTTLCNVYSRSKAIHANTVDSISSFFISLQNENRTQNMPSRSRGGGWKKLGRFLLQWGFSKFTTPE